VNNDLISENHDKGRKLHCFSQKWH